MIISKMKDMFKGWFVGNFKPSVLITTDFEVGYLTHKKGEYHQAHYHNKAVEINYLIKGKMTIQNKELNTGDIFVLYQNEVADPVFLEDCELIVIKAPCVIGDKYLV